MRIATCIHLCLLSDWDLTLPVGDVVHSRLVLASEVETRHLAKAMLPHLKPGDCLLLEGPVGAGKSAFARALIQQQMAQDGTVEDVPSPTFTLVQNYETSRGPFCHADLYRLSDSTELIELDFPDVFESAICLIEWPARLGSLKPERHLLVTLDIRAEPEMRNITLRTFGQGWEWVQELEAATQFPTNVA